MLAGLALALANLEVEEKQRRGDWRPEWRPDGRPFKIDWLWTTICALHVCVTDSNLGYFFETLGDPGDPRDPYPPNSAKCPAERGGWGYGILQP